jgi:type VI secretion system protein VasG
VEFVGRPAGSELKADGLNPALQNALDKFTLDVTAKAREGKIDPVFGRDTEIRQMVDILSRRRKNNPILVGEPGVGKTALVEGLALRIAEGNVPEALKPCRCAPLTSACCRRRRGERRVRTAAEKRH